ncbi:hypothetical protein [Staphylococcus delphini]|uniref:hypothetical protein n=1 Tax=Staphylococcus delphini TaxID=53344 RepID=UPI0023B2159F|nr:hypothetical protein [Staphylococcus delphini]MDE9829518.1 hypothetical protein [Staphylococcus delphini]
MNAFKPHDHIAGELEKMRIAEFEQPTTALLQQFENQGSDVHFQIIDGGMTDLARRIVSIYHSYLETLNNGQMPRCLKAQKIKN